MLSSDVMAALVDVVLPFGFSSSSLRQVQLGLDDILRSDACILVLEA